MRFFAIMRTAHNSDFIQRKTKFFYSSAFQQRQYLEQFEGRARKTDLLNIANRENYIAFFINYTNYAAVKTLENIASVPLNKYGILLHEF